MEQWGAGEILSLCTLILGTLYGLSRLVRFVRRFLPERSRFAYDNYDYAVPRADLYMPPVVKPTPQRQTDWLDDLTPHIQQIKLSTIASADNVLVAGAKGSGKTTVLRTMLMCREQDASVALDPHNSPGKWPCTIIGGGEQYEDIDRAMLRMHADMVDRFKALNNGTTKEGQFPRRTVIGDEFYGITQELNGKNGTVHAGDMLSKRLARGRKVGECMMVAAQNDTVKALGIEGNADIKLCFDYIVFLGALISTRGAYHGCPDDIQKAAFGQDRPGIVWHPERNNWYVLMYDLVPVKEGQVLSVFEQTPDADQMLRHVLRHEDEVLEPLTKVSKSVGSIGSGTSSRTTQEVVLGDTIELEPLIRRMSEQGMSRNQIAAIIGGNRQKALDKIRAVLGENN